MAPCIFIAIVKHLHQPIAKSSLPFPGCNEEYVDPTFLVGLLASVSFPGLPDGLNQKSKFG
jgi:hypothetical protein